MRLEQLCPYTRWDLALHLEHCASNWKRYERVIMHLRSSLADFYESMENSDYTHSDRKQKSTVNSMAILSCTYSTSVTAVKVWSLDVESCSTTLSSVQLWKASTTPAQFRHDRQQEVWRHKRATTLLDLLHLQNARSSYTDSSSSSPTNARRVGYATTKYGDYKASMHNTDSMNMNMEIRFGGPRNAVPGQSRGCEWLPEPSRTRTDTRLDEVLAMPRGLCDLWSSLQAMADNKLFIPKHGVKNLSSLWRFSMESSRLICGVDVVRGSFSSTKMKVWRLIF